MKHNLYILFSLVLLASVGLSGCSAPTAAPATVAPATQAPATQAPVATSASTPADTIIIGTTDAIASFDPADAYAIRDWEIIRNINEGLLKWKPGTGDQLIPALATAMPVVSADGLTYTLTLRDGIKFGDGTDLTAQMYADSITRLLTIGPSCPNGVANALATPYVDSVTAPDAKTIVFKLKQAVAYFPQLLASTPYTPADPKNFPADKCNLFPTAPVYGTGPWYVSQYTAKEQIVFEPNPYYNGAFKPQVKKIIVRDFADPQTEALAIQNGEIDIAWRYIGYELFGKLKGATGIQAQTINGGGIRYLILNHTMKPTDDPNVDKAIAASIDRNEIADTVFGGQVNPLYSMVPPGFLGASQSFDTMYTAPNVDQAKKYLEASGYSASKPLQLEMWYPPEHYGAETAAWMQVIKKQIEATGEVQVTLKSQEWSTYVSALTGGDSYSIGVLGWFFDYPDPSNYLEPFVYNGGEGTNVSPQYPAASPASSSTEAPTPSATEVVPTLTAQQQGWKNYGKPINVTATKLITLLNQAATETDMTKRADLYKQAQDVYAEMVVTIPLFYNPEYIVYRDYIHGSSQYPTPETLNIAGTIEFNYSLLTKTP